MPHEEDWGRLTRLAKQQPEFIVLTALLALAVPIGAAIAFYRGEIGLGLLGLLGIVVVLGMVRFCSRRLFLMYVVFLAVQGLAWGAIALAGPLS